MPPVVSSYSPLLHSALLMNHTQSPKTQRNNGQIFSVTKRNKTSLNTTALLPVNIYDMHHCLPCSCTTTMTYLPQQPHDPHHPTLLQKGFSFALNFIYTIRPWSLFSFLHTVIRFDHRRHFNAANSYPDKTLLPLLPYHAIPIPVDFEPPCVPIKYPGASADLWS